MQDEAIWLRLLIAAAGMILVVSGESAVRHRELPRRGNLSPLRGRAAILMGILLLFGGVLMLSASIGFLDLAGNH